MFSDHYVKFCSEETIAEIALAWRNAANILNDGNFDIIDFVENVLSKQYATKGALNIRLFDASSGSDFASVTYNPLTLHVDSEVWELAKRGDPDSRYMIAHEIGHILLHDHYARPFSNDPSQQRNFAQNEHSAEWQANTFAGFFLLPDHLVRSFGDAKEMSTSCGVPKNLARDRVATVEKAARKSRNFEGDLCSECRNFTLIRNGLSLRCETCGAIKAI
jgi:IrrE N-terminal-like domain